MTLKKHKLIIHYGEQQTEDWHNLKLGKFSSSEIFKLFENPTKQSRAKAAMMQIKNGLWVLNGKMIEHRPTTDDLTYAGKYLNEYGLCSGVQIKNAKKELKGLYKDNSFHADCFDLEDLEDYESLLVRACYAIENIDILAGSATGYAKTKALEIIHQEKKDSLNKSQIKQLDWGNENEPLASEYFQDKTLRFVDDEKISFAIIDGMECGTSPDDTIGKVTPSEYKCPFNPSIHYDHTFIRSGGDLFRFDKQKYYQLQHQIWTLGGEFGFWSSFDPRLLRRKQTEHKALHTIKVKLNTKIAKQFERRIKNAIRVRDEFVNKFLNSNDSGLWD